MVIPGTRLPLLRKPLDGFENLAVNMVMTDALVNPILLKYFHNIIFHPGQMNLYLDAFQSRGKN